MAQRKRRETKYQLVGGINEKTSKYNLNNAQVSGLYNMDFNEPGALSKRPGSTQMVGAGTSGTIRSLFEFERLGGASYLLAGSNNELLVRNGTAGFSSISSGWTNNQPEDYLAFLNKAWIANGQITGSYDGTSFTLYGLPALDNQNLWTAFLTTAHSGPFQVFGITSSQDLGSGDTVAIGYLLTRWERNDEYKSPIVESGGDAVGNQSGKLFPITPYQLGISPKALLGTASSFRNYGQSTIITLNVSLTPSASYNIQNLAVYLYVDTFNQGGQSDLSSDTTNPGNGTFNDTFDYSNFRFLTSIPVPSSFTQLQLGPFGFSWSDVLNSPTFPSFSGMIGDYFTTYTPKYLEVNSNRFFQSGFSNSPSVVYFSNIGEPEVIEPENFFEVRTDDGDRITAMAQYNNELTIFKRDSFYKLLGDSPDNYTLSEISREYGCLSNKAVVEYRDKLMFLDEKGIVEYNGASWDLVSYPVEDTFRRMNLSAALEKAVAVHLDFRNQIWWGIPVDGSSENNLTVVYDYLIGAWTWFDGYNASAFAMAKQELSRDHLWFGDYSGMIHYFSPSFYADNGQGITCLVQTKFDSPDGENIQNIYRRLFIDNDTPSGTTGAINVEVFKDYDRSSVQATFSVFQSQFQTRRDFGVSARSIAFDMSHNSASLPLTLYGYTVQRRYLRDV